MKKEELFETLQDIDEKSIREADAYTGKKVFGLKRAGIFALCGFLLVITVLKFPFQNRSAKNTVVETGGNIAAVEAKYPEATAVNMKLEQFIESDEHWEWWSAYRENLDESSSLQEGMQDYYSALMKRMLVKDGENTVCSPLNLYFAFSMLAEVSDGNTRQQILDVLGQKDMETLRKSFTALWLSNNIDTPALKSIPANSLWLNQNAGYNADTLNRLAETYYTSSYSGVPGSEEMDKALEMWTNVHTGGLLEEYTKDLKLDPNTVLALVSVFYYKAMWTDDFSEQATSKEIFHGQNGESEVDMMHRTDTMSVYRNDSFSALSLLLNDSGSMTFYLPNEGIEVNAILKDPDLFKVLHSYDEENRFYPEVHLSVPKFKVSFKTDLLDVIKDLGMTDVLDMNTADFTALSNDSDDLYLSSGEHAAMVEIDEHGVSGAAYTELAIAEGAALPEEEIDFVLDRPFLFVITGRDGSILFSGIIRNLP